MKEYTEEIKRRNRLYLFYILAISLTFVAFITGYQIGKEAGRRESIDIFIKPGL